MAITDQLVVDIKCRNLWDRHAQYTYYSSELGAFSTIAPCYYHTSLYYAISNDLLFMLLYITFLLFCSQWSLREVCYFVVCLWRRAILLFCHSVVRLKRSAILLLKYSVACLRRCYLYYFADSLIRHAI